MKQILACISPVNFILFGVFKPQVHCKWIIDSQMLHLYASYKKHTRLPFTHFISYSHLLSELFVFVIKYRCLLVFSKFNSSFSWFCVTWTKAVALLEKSQINTSSESSSYFDTYWPKYCYYIKHTPWTGKALCLGCSR